MTKYKRSKTKLIVLIKEIFGVCEISPDTKAIVLVLAGTLPSKKFKRWIDSIPQLNPFNAHFKQINALRWEYGTLFRNYILVTAMQVLDRDICSDELQSFIIQQTQVPDVIGEQLLTPNKHLIFSVMP